MLKRIDAAIDGITMYRLTLYVLLGILGVAVALGTFGLLPFSPLSMLLSAAFLLIICWAMNTLLAKIPQRADERRVHAHYRADPGAHHRSGAVARRLPVPWLGRDPGDVLEIHSLDHNKHIFNPAVIAVVITSFALGESASWWIATAAMAPATLVGSLLVVRKVRQEEMAAWFVVAALAMMCAVSVVIGPLAAAGGGAAGDRRAAHLRRRCDADRATDSAAHAKPEALSTHC